MAGGCICSPICFRAKEIEQRIIQVHSQVLLIEWPIAKPSTVR